MGNMWGIDKMSYVSIHNQGSPLEAILFAIGTVQCFEELDRETERFKRLAERYFRKVREKNGVKTVGSFKYLPNGLVQGTNNLKIILSPWESKTFEGYAESLEVSEREVREIAKRKEEEKRERKLKREKRGTPKPPARYVVLRKINPFLYYQMMVYLGRENRIKWETAKFVKFKETREQLLKLSSLPNDAKRVLSTELIQREVLHAVTPLMKLLSHNLNDSSGIVLANQDDLMSMDKLIRERRGDDFHDLLYVLRQRAPWRHHDIIARHDHSIIECEGVCNGPWFTRGGYNVSVNALDILYKQVSAISDPVIHNTFYHLGILPDKMEYTPHTLNARTSRKAVQEAEIMV